MGRPKYGPRPIPYHEDSGLHGLPSSRRAAIVAARAAVHTLFPRVYEVVGEPGRTGGYFCLALREDVVTVHGRTWLRRAILRIPVGIARLDKTQKYYRLSFEKADRLARHLKQGHVSSWQCRDEQKNFYAGAIATNKYLFSFSGLPALADEAFMLWLAVYLRVMTLRRAQWIAAVTGNAYFSRLESSLGQ